LDCAESDGDLVTWWQTFSKWGDQVYFKNYRKCLRFELEIVTSQTLKYDVFTDTPYEGGSSVVLKVGEIAPSGRF